MANKELENLRALARKRRAAVTNKEWRIAKNTGVDVRGTDDDPRRPPKVVDRYNIKQLNSYIGELNAFMSRSNGFVASSNGTAIPKGMWNMYKRLETQYNKIGNMHFQEVADLFIPTAGMTIAQREATIRPDSVSAQGAIVNSPYAKIDRKPVNVTSVESLTKLIKMLQRKVKSDYLPKEIKKQRGQMGDMLKIIGASDLTAKAEGLSDHQFNVLWNYTPFATNVSAIYWFMQQGAKSYSAGVVEDYSNDLREILNWASNLVEPQSETASPSTATTRKRPTTITTSNTSRANPFRNKPIT